MNGDLDEELESVVGNRVLLAGPLVDGYYVKLEKSDIFDK